MRASLRAHWLIARITRVDFPAALHAALMRRTFDLVLLDSQTPAISHDVLAASLREHEQSSPVIFINLDEDDVGALVVSTWQRRN